MSMMSDDGPSIEDLDSIKMFIGQISKTMSEDELKTMLEEYGPVKSLNILRDHSSGQSKGCAFATFIHQKDALAAQTALHKIKTMPGVNNPIQMQPAEGFCFTQERKVFVGMLSRNLTEEDITMIFAPFGTIEDCVVLKDGEGNSKGCAFISFETRECALNAIKSMHHSQTMKGCKSPLVVKFADSQKDKESRKFLFAKQSMQGGMHGGMMSPRGGVGGGNAMNIAQLTQYTSMLQQQQHQPFNNQANNPMLAAMSLLTGGSNNAAQLQQLLLAIAAAAPVLQSNPAMASLVSSLIANAGGISTAGNMNPGGSPQAWTNQMNGQWNAGTGSLQQQQQYGDGSNSGAQMMDVQSGPFGGASSSSNQASSSVPGFVSGGVLTPSSVIQQQQQQSGTQSGSPGLTTYGPYGNKLQDGNQSVAASLVASLSGLGGNLPAAGTADMLTKAYSGFQHYLASMNTSASMDNNPAGSQVEGPEGANLFIYHLPPEFRDHDLAQMFSPYGKVISAKVFIDKQTNASKCFGFVSFDDPDCAQAAIQSMNGTNVGNRRLKVSLKNSKEKNKPY